MLSTSGEHCLQDWCGPVQSCQQSLSGGEHCYKIGAVLCSLVNLSFWWRALLTDWCGPVQSCQHLFLVESITYKIGAGPVQSCQQSFWWKEHCLQDWCRTYAVLSTSLSGGEHCLPDWCGPVTRLSTSLSGGEQCSPPEREVDKTAQDCTNL